MANQRRGIRRVTLGVLAIAPTVLLSVSATAIPIVEAETTPPQNNTLETAEDLDSDVTAVLGELGLLDDPTAYDYREEGFLEGDRADTITFPGLTPGEPFFAWIDNSTSGIDTVLGVFDEAGTLVNLNDDGSPVGVGNASGVSGRVNGDGTIVLGISGFPDLNFDGQYSPEDMGPTANNPAVSSPVGGDYTLYLQMGTDDAATVDPSAADYSFPGRLDAGNVDDFRLSELPPSTPFVAWIDNASSEVDTVMGVFSADGELQLFDDDGSPVGTGVASAIASSTREDGTLDLKVGLFPDFNFNGEYTDDSVPLVDDQGDVPLPFMPYPHGVEGDYEVFVKLGIERLAGDIDFYTYSDLEPGQEFTAEVALANFDSLLGWFDETGTLLQSDDDGGEGTLSRIVGTVPDSGTVTLAVTGFEDQDFAGIHTEMGQYLLQFTVAP